MIIYKQFFEIMNKRIIYNVYSFLLETFSNFNLILINFNFFSLFFFFFYLFYIHWNKWKLCKLSVKNINVNVFFFFFDARKSVNNEKKR